MTKHPIALAVTARALATCKNFPKARYSWMKACINSHTVILLAFARRRPSPFILRLLLNHAVRDRCKAARTPTPPHPTLITITWCFRFLYDSVFAIGTPTNKHAERGRKKLATTFTVNHAAEREVYVRASNDVGSCGRHGNGYVWWQGESV